MKLQLPVTTEEKYRYIIEIIGSTLAPFNQLRPREKDVLALLYYYNFKHKDIPEDSLGLWRQHPWHRLRCIRTRSSFRLQKQLPG